MRFHFRRIVDPTLNAFGDEWADGAQFRQRPALRDQLGNLFGPEKRTSGGAGEARHVAEALDIAQAALLASILHEDPTRLGTLREELRAFGVALR